jgi:hypothetical protein
MLLLLLTTLIIILINRLCLKYIPVKGLDAVRGTYAWASPIKKTFIILTYILILKHVQANKNPRELIINMIF